ncbi:aromatic acid exporter family protein [Quadrisphaera sp. DSM 44207]|uniref:FUSC family protein n=1 Tax=Quadrisphaera sp. DSM 44207 TaxID=1881057 RepID=UPI0008922C6A|nr:FUSC family protein [Quadrisphaera sp. DSM 44207]SDQ08348.1 Fusaric acid resistance protein-like [Quadrisphaera sp. DSM 44207]
MRATAPPLVRRTALQARPAPVAHRVRATLPTALQCGLATGASWWVAGGPLGHPDPVFAGTAAVVCLAAGAGGRARQAVDLLAGVFVGVLAGQLVRALGLDPGAGQSLVAVVLALLAVSLVDTRPLALIQAGSSALFVLALPAAGTPVTRLSDAAVGGVLGLLCSQVLFTPDPVRLLTAPAHAVLGDVAAALRAGARAAREQDGARAAAAVGLAHRACAGLGQVATARGTARDVSARTLRGRRRADAVRAHEERLDGVEEVAAATVLAVSDLGRSLDAGSRADPAVPAVLERAADDVDAAARDDAGDHRARLRAAADALCGVLPRS